MVRRLEPFRRPNSVTTLSIYVYIVRKIHQSSQFNNVFRKILSGKKKYIYIFFSRFHVFARAYVRIWTLRSWRLYLFFFYLMTDVRERRKGIAFFNVLWINFIFKMDLSNIHPIFIYRASLVTANRKQRYFRSPWLRVSISPLISWVNPFPSTFINRTACFPRKVSSFRVSRMSPWKIKLDEVELRSPSFDSFPFLL